MANKSGHFVQNDERKLVISELEKLIIRADESYTNRSFISE